MSFLGVGPAELLLILIVALVVFGPERLPKMAKDLGKAMGKWKETMDEIQSVTDLRADKVLELVAKEEEMQEPAQEVAEPTPDEKQDSTEEVVHDENVAQEPAQEVAEPTTDEKEDGTDEVVHDEKVAQEPEVEH